MYCISTSNGLARRNKASGLYGSRVQSRMAPNLTETRVPGGGYPESSGPEWTPARSRMPGYLDPGYPGTRCLY